MKTTPKKKTSAPQHRSSISPVFLFFLLSGFSGLVYQVVWLRLSMASFGVTTPLVSIVLSVFMGGLAIGSWGAGRLTDRLHGNDAGFFVRFYAFAELLIGLSGLVVSPLLRWGRELLTSSNGQTAWDSAAYYVGSAACITAALLPFCICMGATFPIAMAAIRRARPDASPRSFSYLYVANVVGAMLGALGAAFVLIEALGLQNTLFAAAAVNVTVAAAALAFSRRITSPAVERAPKKRAEQTPVARPSRVALAFLFTTGLVSLALEVVWTRQFVPFQGPLVYAFATMLALYLAATAAGSLLYRRRSTPAGSTGEFPWATAAILSGSSGLLALLAADPRLPLQPGLGPGSFRVFLAVAPFCGVLGYFTAMLVDRVSAGDPHRAGTAYALNTLGCIVGPVVSGFVLLPRAGERWTTLLLVLPLFAFAAFDWPRLRKSFATQGLVAAGIAATVLLLTLTRDFETIVPDRVVLRDHTATVIAAGSGMNKSLLVNGQSITILTPITKMMVHLPMAFLERAPEKGLVLCLGMGTSFRSMLSWGIPTTVVELVPSVPPLLGFFHPDGNTVARNPLGRIVLDDARRYLDRSAETYDVIVVDPPPPMEAAASSLLYSSEFYESARRRLHPDGILQQWIPAGENIVLSAAARAIVARFPHVRVFGSGEGWGLHFLASARPIPDRTAAALAARLPQTAARDLIEWGPTSSGDLQFARVTQSEVPLRAVIELDPNAPVLTDDRPVNEYYFLRRRQ